MSSTHSVNKINRQGIKTGPIAVSAAVSLESTQPSIQCMLEISSPPLFLGGGVKIVGCAYDDFVPCRCCTPGMHFNGGR